MKNEHYFRVEVRVDSNSTSRIVYSAEISQYFFVRNDEDRSSFGYDLNEIKESNIRDLKMMVAKIKDWHMIDINIQSGSIYGSRVVLDSYRALKEHRFTSEYKISAWDGSRFSWDNEPVRRNIRPLLTLLSMSLQKAYELWLEKQG